MLLSTHLTSNFVYRNFKSVSYHQVISTKCRLHTSEILLFSCIQCCDMFCEKSYFDSNKTKCCQGKSGQHIYKKVDEAKDHFLTNIMTHNQVLMQKCVEIEQSLSELKDERQKLLNDIQDRDRVMTETETSVDMFCQEDDAVFTITNYHRVYEALMSIKQMFTNTEGETVSLEQYLINFQRRFIPSMTPLPSVPIKLTLQPKEPEKVAQAQAAVITLLPPYNVVHLESESILFVKHRASGDLFYASSNSKFCSIRGIDGSCIPLTNFVSAFNLDDSCFITATHTAVTRTEVTSKTLSKPSFLSSEIPRDRGIESSQHDHLSTANASDARSSISAKTTAAEVNNNAVDLNGNIADFNNNTTDENLSDPNNNTLGFKPKDDKEISKRNLSEASHQGDEKNAPMTFLQKQLNSSLNTGNSDPNGPGHTEEASGVPASSNSTTHQSEANNEMPTEKTTTKKNSEDKIRPNVKIEKISTYSETNQRSPIESDSVVSSPTKWNYDIKMENVVIHTVSDGETVVSVHLALGLILALISKKADQDTTILAQKIHDTGGCMKPVLTNITKKMKPVFLDVQACTSEVGLMLVVCHPPGKLDKGKRAKIKQMVMFNISLDEEGFSKEPREKWRTPISGSIEKLSILDSGAVIALTPLQELMVLNEQGDHTQTIQLHSGTSYPASDISVYGEELAVARFDGGVEFYKLNLILTRGNSTSIDEDDL